MKKWARAKTMGIGRFVVCPFCPDRWYQALNETMPWCGRCGCEYRITDRGAIFDPSIKTPRYALGKAINLSGGMKLGKL